MADANANYLLQKGGIKLILEFKVTEQSLFPVVPSGAFEVVAGSRNYLQIQFEFGAGWEDITNKTAVFRRIDTEPIAVILQDDKCLVPHEVIVTGEFYVSVIGGDLITTEEIPVQVQGGGPTEGVPPQDPTPSVYNQMLDAFDASVTQSEQAATAAKLSEDNAEQSATESAGSASLSVTQANTATLASDSAADSKNESEQSALDAQQMAVLAAQMKTDAEAAAQQAQSIATSIPVRYYRTTVEGMESIANPKQGDLCYVTDYTVGRTELYTYDTTDVDGDNINPEWVLLGVLRFADLDRQTLLDILQLATVAITGSYNDLIDKPKRYESFINLNVVADAVSWDYTQSDKAIVTLSANTTVSITNAYNGAVGLLQSYGDYDLTLPANSKKSTDWDYLILPVGGHWLYMFLFDGVNYQWTRAVLL